jgi:glycerol uptake operon antiterminator
MTGCAAVRESSGSIKGRDLLKIEQQIVIPAARTIKDFESLLATSIEYIVVLDVHIGQLIHLSKMGRQHEKKLLVHADLVQGLKPDEAGAQFLCQWIQPTGLISTHASVMVTAKKHGIISIQRIFLLDSHALATSVRVIKHCDPDYVEILPGVVPKLVREVASQTKRKVIAGGFIETMDEVTEVLAAGASAVSTSSLEVRQFYFPTS